jgi:hypothetical protein
VLSCSGANAFFFALAALLLLVFILWCVLENTEKVSCADTPWHATTAARLPASAHNCVLCCSCMQAPAALVLRSVLLPRRLRPQALQA